MPKITGIKTAANVELQNVWEFSSGVNPEPDQYLIPKVQYYMHFDLTNEQLGRTGRYNCWGFTFIPRRYWINSSTDVDQILNDNCIPITPGSVKRGDVIRYRDSNNVTTHTGRVWDVSSGNCTKVRSKWGGMGEYVHIPLEPYITPSYGTNLAYFRQVAPLKGIGDLWIHDASNDTGEQYSSSLWSSPDIVVDAPPYGSVDVNPVFNKKNRVSVIVHNRSNVAVKNARVRYYWADPHSGFAPSNWKLIPSSTGHPNPSSTFTVPPNSSIQAPYVEWTPTPVSGVQHPAHQCLLAVAYINDDPKDSSNPDPLVYPFNLRWENNNAARNVHIVHLKKGSKTKLQIGVAIPYDGVEMIKPSLHIRLNCVPRLPIFGFPIRTVPPTVSIVLEEKEPFRIADTGQIAPFEEVWGPFVHPRSIDFELHSDVEEEFFRPLMVEKTIGWHYLKQVALEAKEPVQMQIEIAAPENAVAGSNYLLRIEQEVEGEITGCYTVVIIID
jgi:hypothetical protein